MTIDSPAIATDASPVQSADSRRTRTRSLVTAALVTALMAASGWVSIPLGPVPITLQTFVVVLAALLLAPEWAAAAVGAYVALGAIGVPVFAHGTAGLGVLAGPTGGYLFGFVLGACLGSLARTLLVKRGAAQVVADVTAAVVVIVVIYALGWAQLAYVLHLNALHAFAAGVAPFLVPDAIKAAVAIVIATAVRRAIEPV